MGFFLGFFMFFFNNKPLPVFPGISYFRSHYNKDDLYETNQDDA